MLMLLGSMLFMRPSLDVYAENKLSEVALIVIQITAEDLVNPRISFQGSYLPR